MSESSENDSSAASVSLVLEIRGKTPVLERIIFLENGKKEGETFEPQKRNTTKAIATVLTLFRAHPECASFRIASNTEDKHLVKFIVSAVRETNKNSGKIYAFADGKFLKLFLAPPDPKDFSYVDLDMKRLKPASVTVRMDGLDIQDEADLKKLAEQLATSGGWKLWVDYPFSAPPAPSSTPKVSTLLPPPEEKIPRAIQGLQDRDHNLDGQLSRLLDKDTGEKSNEGFIQTQQPFALQPGQLAQDENELGDPDIFDVPKFIDLANRASRKSELTNLIIAHPIISVAGLSGSGKSYLVASFLNVHFRFRNKGSVIWHDPDPSGGESLEILIAKLNQPMKLKGKSIFERCKQLMRQLETNDQLLIIDDFQTVDKDSYSPLIEAASRLKAPAHLILICQTNIGMMGDIPDLPHLEVSGFNPNEIESFLIQKRLGYLDNKLVDELLRKTEGLPVAVGLFAYMINGLKRSPEQVLRGTMITSERLRSWLAEITISIGEPAADVLRMISLCDGPFNMGVFRMLCQQAGREPLEVFETLQRAYLVQLYSPFRWRLHNLIADLCRKELSEPFKERIHFFLGSYHWKIAQGIARRFSAEKALVWQAKACQHFQRARAFESSNRVAHGLIKEAKARGFYRVIIRLLGEELKLNPSKDPWLTYHYAHCCLIIGKHEQSLSAIKPLISKEMRDDPSLKISIVRLHAGVLDAIGKPELALDTLQTMLTSVDIKVVRGPVASQVKAVMVRLLIKLKEYDRAEKLSEELFNESDGNVGRAVALANWGIVLESTERFKLADDKFGQAVSLFGLANDYRGYGWSLSHHAMCQLKLGNHDGASLMLREALNVKADIDEASEEYLTFLRTAQPLFRERLLVNLIGAEIRRVSAQVKTFG